MGIMNRARAAVQAFRAPVAVASGSPSAAVDGLNDPTGSTFLNILGGTISGASGTEARTMSLPTAFRAAEMLCGVFAMTPLIYYRRLPGGGKEKAEGDPRYKLMHDRPNGFQSPFAFKEVLLGDLLLKGRFGSYVHRDPLYRPEGLSRVDPAGIAVSRHWDRADGTQLFYDVSLPDGSRDRLTANDFWYIPGFSRDGLLGVDRLKIMSEAIEAAVATSEFAARFWQNNAQPSTILTTKHKVEAPEKAKIRTDWSARFSGPSKAGGVAVLDQEMDAKFLAHDNKASQFVETRSFHVLEVARAFGVPPHLLFELSRATFSNIEQQSLEFIVFCMMTHYERVAGAATQMFAEPGHFYEFLPDALLRGDIKSRYEAYGVAVDKGILNPNEVRRRENMNDREGGDEYRVGSGSTIEGQKPAPPEDHRSPPVTPTEEDE